MEQDCLKSLFVILILAKNPLKIEIILSNRVKYFNQKNVKKIRLHSKVIAKVINFF